MVVGENGILNRATDASKKTQTASEKEAIEFIMSDIKTGLMINEEIPNEKYIGEKLSSMSAVTGDWKNVTVGENTYKDGWYLLEKGDKITGYGEAKLNWLINYDTGELIELKDGEYTIANANASGAIVDKTLKLNIDPVTLQNPEKWGDGVSFHGGNPQDVTSKSELRFDGIDDYLKIENINIENINIEKSSGLTFEFYGKMYDDNKNMLGKTKFNKDNTINTYIGNFRINGENDFLRMCVGQGDCKSELSESQLLGDVSRSHWLRFTETSIPSEEEIYISFSIDFQSCKIIAYQNGKRVQDTTCSKEYLDHCTDIFDNSIPFTVGLVMRNTDEGNVPTYSRLDLYSCRIYSRVLEDYEVLSNYAATTNYHKDNKG